MQTAQELEAAARFVRETGGLASIGALGDAAAILAGRAGTRVIPERARSGRPQHAGAVA